jgi:hypothetical protein
LLFNSSISASGTKIISSLTLSMPWRILGNFLL